MAERDAEISRLKKSIAVSRERSKSFEADIAKERNVIEELKKSCNIIEAQLTQSLHEKRTLKKKLEAAQRKERTNTTDKDDDGDEEDEDDNADSDDDDDLSDGTENEDERPDAIFDGLVHCCNECGFEVVDGICQSCGMRHSWNEVCTKQARSNISTLYIYAILLCRKWAKIHFPPRMRLSFRIVSFLLAGRLPCETWAFPTFTAITAAAAQRTARKSMSNSYGMSHPLVLSIIFNLLWKISAVAQLVLCVTRSAWSSNSQLA